jgi:hypothetical protein
VFVVGASQDNVAVPVTGGGAGAAETAISKLASEALAVPLLTVITISA